MEQIPNPEQEIIIDSLQSLHEAAKQYEFDLNTAGYEDPHAQAQAVTSFLDDVTRQLGLWGEEIEVTGKGMMEVESDEGRQTTNVRGHFIGQNFGFFATQAEVGIESGPVMERIIIGHQIIVPGSRATTMTSSSMDLFFIPVTDVQTIETSEQRKQRELNEVTSEIGSDDFANKIDQAIYSDQGQIDFKSLSDLFDHQAPDELPTQQLDTYLTYINKVVGYDGQKVRLLSNYLLQPNLPTPRLIQASGDISGMWRGLCMSGKLLIDGEKYHYDDDERQLYLALEIYDEEELRVFLVPSAHIEVCLVEDE